MTTPEPPHDTTSSGGSPMPQLDPEKLKLLAKGGKKSANIAWRMLKGGWKVVRPRKWDLQHIMYSVVIIAVILITLSFLWDMVWNFFLIALGVGILIFAFWLFFSAKPPAK